MQDNKISSQYYANKEQEEADVQRLSNIPIAQIKKQKAYLRSIKFTGIMDRFLNVKSSGTAQRKVRLAYYLVPMFVFTGISMSHFINTSFGIYLKYQALVDTYHKQVLNARYEQIIAEDNATDTENKRQVQKSERMIQNSIIMPPMSQVGPSKASMWIN